MDPKYLNKIKEIIDNEDIYISTNRDFNLDNIFYIIQYPDHWKHYFGPQVWKIFENFYFASMAPNILTIPERWKQIIPTDVKDMKVAEIACNIGVETYFIAKELKPAKLVSFEFNPTAIELTKLSMEMHNLTNVEVVQADMISHVADVPAKYTDFDVTILSGSFFLFDYPQPSSNYDFVKASLNDLFEFIVSRTNKVFYFLALNEVLFDIMNLFFARNTITITKETKLIPSKQYMPTKTSFKIKSFDVKYDYDRTSYSGYINL